MEVTMSNEDEIKDNSHNNVDIDVILEEITAFAEGMHVKNQHKKKICLRCMMIHGLPRLASSFGLTAWMNCPSCGMC